MKSEEGVTKRGAVGNEPRRAVAPKSRLCHLATPRKGVQEGALFFSNDEVANRESGEKRAGRNFATCCAEGRVIFGLSEPQFLYLELTTFGRCCAVCALATDLSNPKQSKLLAVHLENRISTGVRRSGVLGASTEYTKPPGTGEPGVSGCATRSKFLSQLVTSELSCRTKYARPHGLSLRAFALLQQ